MLHALCGAAALSIARVQTWQMMLWAALLTASCDPFPALAFFASLRARAVADF